MQVRELLLRIEAGGILPPLVVLQVLSKNPRLKLSLVKDYVTRQLQADSRWARGWGSSRVRARWGGGVVGGWVGGWGWGWGWVMVVVKGWGGGWGGGEGTLRPTVHLHLHLHLHMQRPPPSTILASSCSAPSAQEHPG